MMPNSIGAITAADPIEVASVDSFGSDSCESQDDYNIEKRFVLGHGGSATVFKASERSSLKVVAVKCMSKFFSTYDQRQAKCEAGILQRLNHCNVVGFKAAFEDDVSFQLVLEYCQGGDLLERLGREKTFSEMACRTLMAQVLDVVSYIHAKSICHRDVKLENLCLLRNGRLEGNSLKLIDFGLALECGPNDRISGKVGTPQYAAPELLRGQRYGHEIDEWACGVTMFAMLSGRFPFGNQTQQVIRRVKGAQFDFSNSAWCAITTEAQSLIRRLLTKDVNNRFTAHEAVNDEWFNFETQ